WLNPTPFVFFAVLAFYFACSKNYAATMVSLGISTMFKQYAAIFFPLLVILAARSTSTENARNLLKRLFKYAIIFALPIILISLPFLIIEAPQYLQGAFLSHLGYSLDSLTTFNPSPASPITFTSYFLWIGMPQAVILPLAYLLQLYILLGGCVILICIRLLRYPTISHQEYTKNSQVNPLFPEILFWSFILVICFQVFSPHGSYKYYLLLLVPFASILFDYNDFNLITQTEAPSLAFQKRYLVPTLLCWFIFVIDRDLYFLFLLIWMFLYIANKIQPPPSMAKNGVRSPQRILNDR
ncbi:MAG TPA: hypothetical protein VKK79_16285, partial [Candidatus Lokiarchaeia archaeon]|nr:hypothetical protein [Candidatus Lokiarchaeia archaeon]